MNDIMLINDAIKKHRELIEYYDAMGCKDDVLVQERYIGWLSELRDYKEKEGMKRKGYRQYSDSTLMSLPKRKIIELLRVAEHNYFVTDEALDNSAKAGMELAKKLDKHARWIETNDAAKKRCSECDVIHLIAQYPHGNANYCPICGAKLDSKDGESK